MSDDSTVTVSKAQANLPKLLKRDTFAISRHGKIVGFYLSRDRIEALVETMELLSDHEFTRALQEYDSGHMKFRDVREVEKNLEQ
jgi:PHD/YefM family antitoxin component YafN of YafNO toxin-antitoxin module